MWSVSKMLQLACWQRNHCSHFYCYKSVAFQGHYMLLFTLAILDDRLISGVHMFTYFSVLFSLLFEKFIYTHSVGFTFFNGTHFSKCLPSHQDKQEQRTETHPNPPPDTDHSSGKLIDQKHKSLPQPGEKWFWKHPSGTSSPGRGLYFILALLGDHGVLGKYPDPEKAPSAHWLGAKSQQYRVNSKGPGG